MCRNYCTDGWMDGQAKHVEAKKRDSSLGFLTTNTKGCYAPADCSKSGFDDICGIWTWSFMETTSEEAMLSWIRTLWHIYILVILQILSQLHGKRHVAPHKQIRSQEYSLLNETPLSSNSSSATFSETSLLQALVCASGVGKTYHRRCRYFQGLARRSVNRTYWNVSNSYSRPRVLPAQV